MNLNKGFLQLAMITTLFFSLFLISTMALAEGSEESGPERVQITDPDELERLGYPRDADNVWKRVHDEPLADRSTMSEEAREATLGGGLTRRTAYSGFEFVPLTNTVEYVKGPSFLVFNGALTSIQDTPATFEVQLQMPDGSTWEWLDILGSHDSPGDELRITVLSRCNAGLFEAANPTETVLASSTITDQGGAFVLGPAVGGELIDNDLCTYHVRAVFWTDTNAPGILMQLIKVRAEYDIPASLAPLVFQDRFEGA